MNIEKIKKDLEFLKDYETVLYGSHVTGDCREGSDIDVAVITRIKGRDENVELLKGFIGKARPIYDIRMFELLPLKLKASVISDYVTLFGEDPEVSEYFYYYRKLWGDQKRRIMGGYHSSYKEKIAAMRSGK